MTSFVEPNLIALGGSVADEIVRLGGNLIAATDDSNEFDGEIPVDTAIDAKMILNLYQQNDIQLVIADISKVPMSLVQSLREKEIKVESVQPTSIKKTAGMIRQLGTWTGNKEEAIKIANGLEAGAFDRLDRLAHSARPVALPLVWASPLTGAGPLTLVSDILWTAGIANVLSGYDEPYPELPEGLFLGADVVLGIPTFNQWDDFSGLGVMGDMGELIELPESVLAEGRNVLDAVDSLTPTVRRLHEFISH